MNKNQFVKISDEGINNNYNPSHLKVLYALCRYFCYFKENRLNNYSPKALAELCQKSERRIYTSLNYLRRKSLLIKIGEHEYINPFMCFRCNDRQRIEIIEAIMNASKLTLDQLKPQPMTFEYDFRKVSSANEEELTSISTKRHFVPNPPQSTTKSFCERYTDEDLDWEIEEAFDDEDTDETYAG